MSDDTAGDVARFDLVYKRERLAITRLAFLIVRSTPVAEELAQEAFLQLHQHFDAVENPPAFLRTVVVRLAVHTMRRNHMERQRMTIVSADHRAATNPEVDETWEALGRLRPDRRAVLALRFYEDLSHERIAELLTCSPGTVRSRTRRALADLRKELDR